MNIEIPRKKLDLSSAIAEGDIRVLLMVLVHMTGDERWLEPPYKPRRDVRLIPDPHAGMPEEIRVTRPRRRAEVVRERGEPIPDTRSQSDAEDLARRGAKTSHLNTRR
jgi:4-hydroxyacetophenone monooxygenase